MPIQLRLFRLARPLVAVAAAAALLSVLVSVPASAAETKMFVGEKICRVPFVTIPAGQPGGYCLITQANIPFLEAPRLTTPTPISSTASPPAR